MAAPVGIVFGPFCALQMSKYTYEESVRWVREQPGLEDAITLSYLDEDNRVAAERFEASEEFAAIKRFLGIAPGRPPLRILDLGCGNGIASFAFARAGQRVTALDPDPSEDVGLGAIARLLPLVSPGSIETCQGFAESLPLESASFDVVYTRQALHHFRDLGAGIKECARVLKPGGRMFATREHVVSDHAQLQIFLRDHLLHKMHGGENAYPLRTYMAAFNDAGLRVLKCLARFDTVINHFPETNAQVVEQIERSLAVKAHLGSTVARLVMQLPGAEQIGRAYRSRGDRQAGRLYSFLCERRS